MTTLKLHLDAEALARHRNSSRYVEDKRLRPVGWKLDDEDHPLAVELPAPAYLATVLRFDDLDAYRRGAGIATRPTGSDVDPEPLALTDLAETLPAILASLPNYPDAGPPYRDARMAATVSLRSETLAAYCLDVMRAFRDQLPRVPATPSREPVERPPGLSAAERQRRSRERRRAEEDVERLSE